MKVQWFGQNWGAGICDADNHVDIPVGEPCFHCEERIVDDDQGIMMWHLDKVGSYKPYHLDCHLRMILGGLNHLRHLCSCSICGGGLPPDPPEMTKREAAQAAARYNDERFSGANDK